jgi:hypothetical protein
LKRFGCIAIVETSKFHRSNEIYAPKLREIKTCLEKDLSNLRSKLYLLDSESKFFSDLENLKADAWSRACNLELEVEDLKEDSKPLSRFWI